MPRSLKYLSRQSRIFYFALGLALIAVVAIVDHFTGFKFNLSVLYLATICFLSWKLGRTSGMVFSALAVAAWFLNYRLTGHLFPHAFLIHPQSFPHLWEGLVLFATWTVFVLVLDKLKVALANADERFVTVLEGLYQAVYVVDRESGELLYLNQRCRNTFDTGEPLTRSRQIEAQLQPPLPDEDRGGECFDAARKRWYLLHSCALRWIDGRMVVLKIASDITIRKQAEELNRQQREKLQLTSHLVAVGEMATTLAHEINQPLAAIANYMTGCERRLRAGNWNLQEILAALEKAGIQAARASQVIQRVRELVRRREPRWIACDLNRVISNTVGLIEIDTGKSNVQLRLELAPELPTVYADEVMLEQAIFNLTRNAIEAMRQTPPDERELTMRSRFNQGGAIEIEIADTGCGIPALMTTGASFEPFFTTKPGGLGMGLNICRSIMELHHGQLWATRNPGRGSTFHLTLPLTQT